MIRTAAIAIGSRYGLSRQSDFAGLLLRITAFLIGLSILIAPPYAVAESFARKIERQTRLSRTDGQLRDVATAAAAVHELVVQIDPRVDPRARVVVPTQSLPLIELVDRFAAHAGATARPLGETILITPIADADRIATLAAVRASELLERPADRFVLDRLRPLDLVPRLQPASPNDLLQAVAASGRLGDLPELPHDMWFVDLRNVTAAEALAFVLVPMNYAFEWEQNGIRLTPLPAQLTVAKSHRIPAGRTREHTKSIVESVCPAATLVFQDRSRVSFTATASEHERVDALLSPERPKRSDAGETRFTLRVDQQPARAVLDSLIQQGVPIAYDFAKLEAAGVRLEAAISLDVEQLSAADLAAVIAKEVGAEAEFRDARWVIVARP